MALAQPVQMQQYGAVPMGAVNVAMPVGIEYGAYQPEVTPYGRLVEMKYITHYPIKVCAALFRIAPTLAQRLFGSLDNCIAIFQRAADVWFDKWFANWPVGIAYAALAAARAGGAVLPGGF